MPEAMVGAASAPADATMAMQKDLLAETHARLAHACDLLSVKVARIGIAAATAGQGSAASLVPTSQQPSVPTHLCPAVTYIDGSEAVPIFADAANRVLPGAALGRVFSMGMWVYAPVAAAALQEPLAAASRGMIMADHEVM